ncbi:MBL fold metallo-hydrolase [Microbacterium sp. BK668]|uniref:MBL fold metallo-hydrolase n=1 Tax=Microbacterium sp. BK668 TaxID=2512118 RepID=UPI001060EEB5|nr:MBL fold metallo-hydrolase [Microbacterium sp. BK668]TDN92025.1 glyoxylase-like metal-dependent hydrolase (beta-lactamase superfamily II) [Microbacterium sp. BK668]
MTRDRDGVTGIAEGVFRLHRAGVNCYLVAASDGLTLVDAGLPGTWPVLQQALTQIRARVADIDAVILTHGHFDHVGMSRRLSDDHSVESHIHVADALLARHPYRYRHESPRVLYPFRHPRGVPILTAMAGAGALTVKGITPVVDVVPTQPLDVPGGLVPVWSPGHTNGHCGFHLAGRGILFSGDALVTLDPYTGRTGPRVVARAATADASTALRSLGNLAATEATLVLPGHGRPYEGDVRRAVKDALAEKVA